VDGSEQSNDKLAIQFCAECSERLCESCVDIHPRVTATRKQELVELSEDGGSMERVMKSGTVNCDKHTDKPLELYCFECNFTIPDGGIGSLPKNFFVQQLMDIASPTSTRCPGCSVDGSEQSNAKLAIKFCLECSERLCNSCIESHRRVTITRKHEIVERSADGGSMERVMKSKTIYCDKHTEEALKLYCFECKKVICMMCFAELHQSHKCSDVKKVAGEMQEQMTVDIKNMRDTVVMCRNLIKGRKDYQVEFNRKLDVTEKEICHRVDLLKHLIDTEKTHLLKELMEIRTGRNKQMNTVVGEIKQYLSFIESMVTYNEQLRDKGTASDVAQQTNALHVRAGELMKLDVVH